ncbi:hypothetical protein QNO07_17910 [Streptomyces sp. 549]|uniref:hypothetical protein n=1 Tax=Streptomyces sp. 549 TaxID=3049076 RepID=UPI0024C315CA|nr:hypothetical protein [Streptomyces sp. 549]MDK1475270.1 hypothetical protein [Streptomyces sp. 549]
MTRSQLAPGVEMVSVPGHGLAVRTAAGDFLRVNPGDVPAEALLDRLAGGPGTHGGTRLATVVAQFEQAGYAGEDHGRDWPAALRDVWLLGDPAVTEPLTAHLRASGAEPRTVRPADLHPVTASPAVPPAAGHGRPAAVVWCLDGPVPEGLWDAADRLPERGAAWLRCHREGWLGWIEPLAVSAGDPTSAHVRARRLAATPAHRELAAYWQGARTTGHPARPSTAAYGLLAALLAADLTEWAAPHSATDAPDGPLDADTPLPANRRLRRIDLRRLTVTEHPVLPVPPVAPLPRPTT